MGRPKINPEKKRTVNFTIRLTAGEQEKLEDAAEVCGKTPAEMIRSKVFKDKFPRPKISKIDMGTYFELKKIGNNLNQLTRLANWGRVHVSLAGILTQLMKQQEKIINEILDHDRHSEDR